MAEGNQIQIRQSPKVVKMWGATKTILQMLEGGPLLGPEIYELLPAEGINSLRNALWRLRRYSLIVCDDDGHFSLTELGRKYCDDFAGGARRAKALGHPNIPETNILCTPTTQPANLPPPPVKRESAIQYTTEEEIKHDLQQETVESVAFGPHLGLSSASFGPQLDQPTAPDPPAIVHDPPATLGSMPVPIEFRGRRGGNLRFVELTDAEKTLAFEAVRSWKETAQPQPSAAEKVIISKMLASVVFSPESSWNQKFFKDRRDAAKFFELTEGEFDEAMDSLGKRGRNFAYCFEIGGEQKVGLYLPWLELLRKGVWRWTA